MSSHGTPRRGESRDSGHEALLSAVMVVRDEASMIAGALDSLAFCDEIIVVVDDRTVDGSAKIARGRGCLVVMAEFESYAQMKNLGVDASRGSWVVHCDADERITPRLARQVEAVASDDSSDVAGVRAPTVNFFWGQRMRHGGWIEQQVRIARRQFAFFSGRVHEKIGAEGRPVAQLSGERWHFSHRSMEESLRKALQYGLLDACDRFESGERPVTVRKMVATLGREFGRRMVRRSGYRDGMPGFIESVFQPFALFCADVMLWELQGGDRIRARYEHLEDEWRRQD